LPQQLQTGALQFAGLAAGLRKHVVIVSHFGTLHAMTAVRLSRALA
jgi:hypothetical protein